MQQQMTAIYFQKLLAFVQEFTFGIKLSRNYNWVITFVWRLWTLNILADFFSYFCLDNRSLENASHINMMLILYTCSTENTLKWIPTKLLNNLQHEKFLTRNFSENCECYVLFESSVFAIKELYRRRNKNREPRINNQKKPWKGVPNIEWKKLLDNTS